MNAPTDAAPLGSFVLQAERATDDLLASMAKYGYRSFGQVLRRQVRPVELEASYRAWNDAMAVVVGELAAAERLDLAHLSPQDRYRLAHQAFDLVQAVPGAGPRTSEAAP